MDTACTIANSGCVSEEGEIYTWGGNLGDNLYGYAMEEDEDVIVPRKVPRLEGTGHKWFGTIDFGAQHGASIAYTFG